MSGEQDAIGRALAVLEEEKARIEAAIAALKGTKTTIEMTLPPLRQLAPRLRKAGRTEEKPKRGRKPGRKAEAKQVEAKYTVNKPDLMKAMVGQKASTLEEIAGRLASQNKGVRYTSRAIVTALEKYNQFEEVDAVKGKRCWVVRDEDGHAA